MLPERLLCHDVVDGVIVPRWLTPDDDDWLARILELHQQHVGQPRRELAARARELMSRTGPRTPWRLALHVLAALVPDAAQSPVSARRARRELFRERGASSLSRDAIVASVAARLSIASAQLEQALFADISGERLVRAPPRDYSPTTLARAANLALAEGLVARARGLSITLRGHARRVAQQATWQGLVCTVHGAGLAAPCRLEISGPLSVVRHSRLYARALASIVPVLPWCRRFRLEARCVLGHGTQPELALVLDDRDPIPPGQPPRRHDSLLEQRFEQDMRVVAPDWDVLREPRAIAAAGTLIFPDFEIGPRGPGRDRVLVEIVGWWRREYLVAKLARLRAAGSDGLITCVDARACAGLDDSLAGLDVIPFRGRVDAAAVVQRAAAMLCRETPAAMVLQVV